MAGESKRDWVFYVPPIVYMTLEQRRHHRTYLSRISGRTAGRHPRAALRKKELRVQYLYVQHISEPVRLTLGVLSVRPSPIGRPPHMGIQ